MNTTPTLNWQGFHGPLWNYGSRDELLANRARAFWQSRQTTVGHVAPVPELVDLHALAADIRAHWPDARPVQ
jgi:hypothetical protein